MSVLCTCSGVEFVTACPAATEFPVCFLVPLFTGLGFHPGTRGKFIFLNVQGGLWYHRGSSSQRKTFTTN